MHRDNLSIITIPILLLAPTVAISVTVSEDAFASDDNDCLTGVSDDCDEECEEQCNEGEEECEECFELCMSGD